MDETDVGIYLYKRIFFFFCLLIYYVGIFYLKKKKSKQNEIFIKIENGYDSFE